MFLCGPKMSVDVLGRSAALEENDVTTVLVSMAAGIPLSAMEDAVVAGTPVVRVMPNTPMLVGRGMNAVATGRFVTEEQLEQVTELLSVVGEVMPVSESDMDAVTALAGSSPAYFFLVAESLIDAGVSSTHPRRRGEARGDVRAGAGIMLSGSGQDPATLRQRVLPGGHHGRRPA